MNKMLSVQKLQFLDVVLKNLFFIASPAYPQLVIRDNSNLIAGDYFIFKDALPLIKTFEINGGRLNPASFEADFEIDLQSLGLSRGMVSPKDSVIWASKNPDFFFFFFFSDSFWNSMCQRIQAQGNKIPFLPFIYEPVFLNNDAIKLPFYALDGDKEYEAVSIRFLQKQI